MMKKVLALMVCSLLMLGPATTYAQGSPGTCKKGRAQNSPHIYFPVSMTKTILLGLKQSSLCKKETKVRKEQDKLQSNMQKWTKQQLDQSVIVLNRALKSNAALKQNNAELLKRNQKLTVELAQSQSQNWKNLVIGFSVGVVITGAVVVTIVLLK